MRALVIEDEAKTAAYLRQGLSENGFNVEICANGDDGLHQALTVENDLIILDVMLPERDGWSILAALRKAGKQTPVLFLTARDTVYDKVKGLELGADDYLVKPFDFAELLARVRTILRRGPARQADILRVADLQLDLPRRKAIRAGVRLDLTAKESRAARTARTPPGRAAVAHAYRRPGVGRQFRQRLERARSRHPPIALEGGRSVSEKADSYRTRSGLCPRRTH